jgi:hypothetical protein
VAIYAYRDTRQTPGLSECDCVERYAFPDMAPAGSPVPAGSGPSGCLPEEIEHCSLLSLLSNPLILYHTSALLPVSSLLALGATSKTFRELIHETPHVFRYLDLTRVRAARFDIPAIDNGGEVWRNVQLDEHVTEDE